MSETFDNILSIDGGGIRGVIVARVLRRIADQLGRNPFTPVDVDLYAGVSTGGLLSLSLADEVSLPTIEQRYVDLGPRLFKPSWFRKNIGFLGKARHRLSPLRAELEAMFSGRQLKHLYGRVLIGAFDLESQGRWKPKFFHNMPGDGSDRDAYISDVGLATSAAPTYFPSWRGYVDGGVYVSNPSMCAVGQALDRRYSKLTEIGDIRLLSFGTGDLAHKIDGQENDWGLLQWAPQIPTLLLDSNGDVPDYQCRQLPLGSYYRFNPALPKAWKMDDAKAIPEMIDFAQSLEIGPIVEWIKENWY